MKNHFFKVYVDQGQAIEMWVMPGESKRWIGPIDLHGCIYPLVAANLIKQGCRPVLAHKNTPFHYFRLKPEFPLSERGQLNGDRAWSLLK